MGRVAGHYLIGRARSADWAWRLAIFAPAVMLCAVALFRVTVLDQAILSWTLVLAGLFAASGLVLAVAACVLVWRTGRHGGGRAVAALIVTLVTAAPFALAARLYAEYPQGNAAATTALSDEIASSVLTPDVVPLAGRDFQATASTVYGAARTALENSGITIADVETGGLPRPSPDDLGVSGTVIAPVPTPRDSVDTAVPYDRFAGLDATDYTITGTAFAPIFAFPSDVQIRIQEENGETFVDMRSQSRTVPLDLGQNRRIVEGFMTRLEEAMNVLEGITPEE